MTRFTLALFAAPVLGLAQVNYGGSSSATTKATHVAASSPTTTSSSGAVHSVSVGQGDALKFSPDSITAQVGDLVEFHFEDDGHSVAEGIFSNPCAPKDASAWFSGFPVDEGKTFTITVNSTDPMWFYCSAPGHCQAGMVGVINAPSGQTVDDYANAAQGTSKSSAPANVQGGTFAQVKNPSGSTGTTTAASGSPSAASSSVSSASAGAAPTQLAKGAFGLSLPLGLLGYMLV